MVNDNTSSVSGDNTETIEYEADGTTPSKVTTKGDDNSVTTVMYEGGVPTAMTVKKGINTSNYIYNENNKPVLVKTIENEGIPAKEKTTEYQYNEDGSVTEIITTAKGTTSRVTDFKLGDENSVLSQHQDIEMKDGSTVQTDSSLSLEGLSIPDTEELANNLAEDENYEIDTNNLVLKGKNSRTTTKSNADGASTGTTNEQTLNADLKGNVSGTVSHSSTHNDGDATYSSGLQAGVSRSKDNNYNATLTTVNEFSNQEGNSRVTNNSLQLNYVKESGEEVEGAEDENGEVKEETTTKTPEGFSVGFQRDKKTTNNNSQTNNVQSAVVGEGGYVKGSISHSSKLTDGESELENKNVQLDISRSADEIYNASVTTNNETNKDGTLTNIKNSIGITYQKGESPVAPEVNEEGENNDFLMGDEAPEGESDKLSLSASRSRSKTQEFAGMGITSSNSQSVNADIDGNATLRHQTTNTLTYSEDESYVQDFTATASHTQANEWNGSVKKSTTGTTLDGQIVTQIKGADAGVDGAGNVNATITSTNSTYEANGEGKSSTQSVTFDYIKGQSEDGEIDDFGYEDFEGGSDKPGDNYGITAGNNQSRTIVNEDGTQYTVSNGQKLKGNIKGDEELNVGLSSKKETVNQNGQVSSVTHSLNIGTEQVEGSEDGESVKTITASTVTVKGETEEVKTIGVNDKGQASISTGLKQRLNKNATAFTNVGHVFDSKEAEYQGSVNAGIAYSGTAGDLSVDGTVGYGENNTTTPSAAVKYDLDLNDGKRGVDPENGEKQALYASASYNHDSGLVGEAGYVAKGLRWKNNTTADLGASVYKNSDRTGVNLSQNIHIGGSPEIQDYGNYNAAAKAQNVFENEQAELAKVAGEIVPPQLSGVANGENVSGESDVDNQTPTSNNGVQQEGQETTGTEGKKRPTLKGFAFRSSTDVYKEDGKIVAGGSLGVGYTSINTENNSRFDVNTNIGLNTDGFSADTGLSFRKQTSFGGFQSVVGAQYSNGGEGSSLNLVNGNALSFRGKKASGTVGTFTSFTKNSEGSEFNTSIMGQTTLHNSGTSFVGNMKFNDSNMQDSREQSVSATFGVQQDISSKVSVYGNHTITRNLTQGQTTNDTTIGAQYKIAQGIAADVHTTNAKDIKIGIVKTF